MDGYLNCITDDGRYWNHSVSDPTTVIGGPDRTDKNSAFAIRDIKKGEEMFEDYGQYEWPDWLVKICYEVGSDMSYFDVKAAETKKASSEEAKPGFQVKYRVGQAMYGLGLFAEENIPKGKLIWKYKRGANVRSFKGEKAV